MSKIGQSFELTPGDSARDHPVRLLVVQEDQRPAVDLTDEDMVMTFPHLVVRELITIVAASLVIVLLALFFDAPLEGLADPQTTPNPAKAPWYFLGLQELLHYYPPLVSGIILPGLMVFALAVIPYFEINLSREPFWHTGKKRKLFGLILVVAVLCVTFFVTAAHPMWPVIVTTLVTGAFMAWPALLGDDTPWRHWLGTRSLAFWVFTWFLVTAVVLSLIGVFFRGPGWAYTLPWRDGIFY